MANPYNLDRPPHLITNEVIRRLENLFAENEVLLKLEGRFRDEIEQLVNQYQDLLVKREFNCTAEVRQRGTDTFVSLGEFPHVVDAAKAVQKTVGQYGLRCIFRWERGEYRCGNRPENVWGRIR